MCAPSPASPNRAAATLSHPPLATHHPPTGVAFAPVNLAQVRRVRNEAAAISGPLSSGGAPSADGRLSWRREDVAPASVQLAESLASNLKTTREAQVGNQIYQLARRLKMATRAAADV